MFVINKRRLRQLLFSVVYTLGVLGIVASGGGGGGSSGSVHSCGIGVSTIAPATDGSNDIWIGVLTKTYLDAVNSVVRLNNDGSEDIRVPVASGEVNIIGTVEVAADGSNDVYVGGDFKEGIFRLNGDGSGDSGFNVGSGFNGRVSKITAAADGSGDVYVGGYFSDYNGTSVSGLVRLNSDGSLDNAGFIAAGASGINSVALATDVPFLGYIYTGGTSGVERWQNNGVQDGGFNPPIGGQVFSIVPAADASGDIYAGGTSFTGLVRLNSGGTVDGGFSTGSGFDSEVHSVIRADDMTGDIYAGGLFTTYDGNPAMGIIRLNIDGSRDLNFIIGNGFTDPNDPFPFSKVESTALAADMAGDIYVGGGFSFYDGIASNGIVRLNNDGSRDSGFSVRISSNVGPCTDENYIGFDL